MKKISSFAVFLVIICSFPILSVNAKECDSRSLDRFNDSPLVCENESIQDWVVPEYDNTGEIYDSGNCGDGVNWQLIYKEDSSLLLKISGNGNIKDYSYSPQGRTPDQLRFDPDYVADSQNPWNSLDLNITEIEIEDGIKSIGKYAFYACRKVKKVTIPDSVTYIGNGAFSMCIALKDISIPNTVTTIGMKAFERCHEIQSIRLPENITVIEPAKFYGCEKLRSVYIPEGVTRIKNSAFNACHHLETIDLPESLTVIEMGAFYQSGITHLIIPENVIDIGTNAFYYCDGLTSVEIKARECTIWDDAFERCLWIKNVTISGNLSLISNNSGKLFYSSRDRLIEVKISEGVNQLKGCIFYGCNKIKKVYIPSTLTDIQGNPFVSADLTTAGVDDSNSIVFAWEHEIPNNAFRLNYYLETITIPEGITTIGNNAFEGCTNLKSVTLPSTLTDLGDCVFSDSGIESIALPSSVMSIGKSTFKGSSIQSFTLSALLESIPEETFSECDMLKELIIPSSICIIEKKAFQKCNSLEEIIVPGTVNSISEYAFSECMSLKRVLINDGVKQIDGNAFYGCSNLEKISLPEKCSISGQLNINSDKILTAGPIGGDYDFTYGFNGVLETGMFCGSIRTFSIADGIIEVGIPIVDMVDNEIITTVDLPNSIKKICVNRDIDELYYNGTQEQWEKVQIVNPLEYAIKNIHFNASAVRQCVMAESTIQLYQFEKYTLNYFVFPENSYDKTVEWKSSDNTIATVDKDGTVVAKAPGDTDIICKTNNGGYEGSCHVTVNEIKNGVVQVYLDKASISIFENESVKLSANIIPQDADNKQVLWECTDSSIAMVDQNGYILALKAGTAKITVTTADGGYTASCSLVVKKIPVSVEGISISKQVLFMTEGDNDTVEAYILPENADEKRVYWESNNNSVALVDSNGTVLARKEGSAIITAKSREGGFTATCSVEVKKRVISVSGISLNRKKVYLAEDETIILSALVDPENADNKDVKWESENENIAVVDDAGIVTAKKVGNTEIKVVSVDGNYEAKCEVVVLEKGSNWYKQYDYYLSNNEIILTKYIGDEKDITIFSKADIENAVYSVVLKGDVFSNNKLIESITIKEGVNIVDKENGESMLCSECRSLVNIELPSNISRIGDKAFWNCSALEEIVIPSTVETIGDRAFCGCNSLTTITYLGEILNGFGEQVFLTNTVDPLLTYINSENEYLISYDWEDDNRILYKEPILVESITLKQSECDVITGETITLEFSLYPENATNQVVKWSSSNESVATVDDDGNIKALAEGTTIITVSTEDGDHMDSCTVTVYAVQFYNCVREGEQNAISGNIDNPLSAWKTTISKYGKYPYDKTTRDYRIRLDEMYLGESAWRVVHAESDRNKSPQEGRQWMLFKFFLQNDSEEELDVADIINTNNPLITIGSTVFYDKTGSILHIYSEAVFEGERKGYRNTDITLKAHESGYCWIGICTDSLEGFPYIVVSNGHDSLKNYVTCLNTDPEYKRKGEDDEGLINDDIHGLYRYLKGIDNNVIQTSYTKNTNNAKNKTNLYIKYNDANYRIDFYERSEIETSSGVWSSPSVQFYYDLNSEEFSQIHFMGAIIKGDNKAQILGDFYTVCKANEISPYDDTYTFTDSYSSSSVDSNVVTIASSAIKIACADLDSLLKKYTNYNLGGIGFSKWPGYSTITEKECTVSFIVDGEEVDSFIVDSGETIDPITPEGRDKEVFVGWYLNDVKWDGSSPIYSDMTLIARFVDVSTGTDIGKTGEIESALDSQPDLAPESNKLTLVKGQKFVLQGGTWLSSNNSYLTISNKGVANAKKVTSASIELTQISNGKVVNEYKVSIVQPSIEKNATIYVGSKRHINLSSSNDLNVFWVSSAPDIASVSTTGDIYGISKGTATVSAFINGNEYKCKVKVNDVDSAKRSFQQKTIVKLSPMQSTTVKMSGFKPGKAVWVSNLEAIPSNRLAKGVVFEDGVVRITKTGKITAIGSGSTTLRAIGGGVNLEFTVDVPKPTTQIIHLNKGSSKTLKIYGTKGSLPWKQSNSILEYTGNKIKGVIAGTTTLTANYENFEYKVIVYVEDPYITNTNVYGGSSKYNVTLKSGQTVVLTHRQVYQNILYKSNKNDVAFIDEAGVLTARNRGKATVTGKVNGKKITINVTVE